jgi:hypothetical protein
MRRFIIRGMKAVTIDNLSLKDHVRWAQDQAIDATFVRNVEAISPYPDISGKSAIFPSQLEALFEWDKGSRPWAHFTAPDNILLFSRRFFSFRLFPNIHWDDTREENEGEEQQDKEEQDEEETAQKKDLIKHLLSVQKKEKSSSFEKDKNNLLALLESIRYIDSMLAQIASRKLQYQKG